MYCIINVRTFSFVDSNRHVRVTNYANEKYNINFVFQNIS